ncbi:hypothetical protein DVH26_10015 [Paenibacillus sp. H1-7]|nr:hypothetical protein DVH26_10015 [Paenibacillus sp. H1-7]
MPRFRNFFFDNSSEFSDDLEINKIEINDKNNQVIEDNIIQTNWNRIYFGLIEMNELRINVYDKNNAILLEVPNKSKN